MSVLRAFSVREDRPTARCGSLQSRLTPKRIVPEEEMVVAPPPVAASAAATYRPPRPTPARLAGSFQSRLTPKVGDKSAAVQAGPTAVVPSHLLTPASVARSTTGDDHLSFIRPHLPTAAGVTMHTASDTLPLPLTPPGSPDASRALPPKSKNLVDLNPSTSIAAPAPRQQQHQLVENSAASSPDLRGPAAPARNIMAAGRGRARASLADRLLVRSVSINRDGLTVDLSALDLKEKQPVNGATAAAAAAVLPSRTTGGGGNGVFDPFSSFHAEQQPAVSAVQPAPTKKPYLDKAAASRICSAALGIYRKKEQRGANKLSANGCQPSEHPEETVAAATREAAALRVAARDAAALDAPAPRPAARNAAAPRAVARNAAAPRVATREAVAPSRQTPQRGAAGGNIADSSECVCLRSMMFVFCKACKEQPFVGRMRRLCPQHPNVTYLLDAPRCGKCGGQNLREYRVPARKDHVQ